MAEGVAGAKLTIVPDCGHMATMEQPAAVNAALDDWLLARRLMRACRDQRFSGASRMDFWIV